MVTNDPTAGAPEINQAESRLRAGAHTRSLLSATWAILTLKSANTPNVFHMKRSSQAEKWTSVSLWLQDIGGAGAPLHIIPLHGQLTPKAGRCRLTVSKPVLKAPTVSAFSP